MTLQLFLENAWKWKCGIPENEFHKVSTYDELKESEWSKDFEQLMRNRLIMGAIRYGRIGVNGKPQYDRIPSMISRLQKYSECGNKEYLIDVANLCLLEFVECNHPKQHFHAIGDQPHVRIKKIEKL
jgi:hypothetical protein